MGEGWSRFLYGGSTGGWEALAVQVKYPDEYNGCFAACPDPIDFRAYCLTNIYEDDNAYYYDSEHKQLEVPSHRDYLGDIQSTLRQGNHLELVLGDKSRSGQQWDIWEATYSPQGDDGYPVRIWDKMTGDIDYDGEVLYGDRAEHCWNGDPELPNAISRLRYNSMYVPKIMKRIAESAPKGADLTSWRYR